MTGERLRISTEKRITKKKLSLRAFVRSIGLSNGHTTDLSLFLAGGKPRPALLAALGYRQVESENYQRVK